MDKFAYLWVNNNKNSNEFSYWRYYPNKSGKKFYLDNGSFPEPPKKIKNPVEIPKKNEFVDFQTIVRLMYAVGKNTIVSRKKNDHLDFYVSKYKKDFIQVKPKKEGDIVKLLDIKKRLKEEIYKDMNEEDHDHESDVESDSDLESDSESELIDNKEEIEDLIEKALEKVYAKMEKYEQIIDNMKEKMTSLEEMNFDLNEKIKKIQKGFKNMI